jgi:hypothetical protein
MDVTGTVTGGSLTLVVTVLTLYAYRRGLLCSSVRVGACGWLTYTCGLATVLITRGVPVVLGIAGAAGMAMLAVPMVVATYHCDRRHVSPGGREVGLRPVRRRITASRLTRATALPKHTGNEEEPAARYQAGVRPTSAS